jgi:aspartyl-tRNA(Asn)/glutamyl-tRNA(Gln) amidotransferase subunit C
MTVETADIEKIATLSRIRVDDKDIADVTSRLNDILSMVDKMQAVDTTGVTPMDNPLDATQRLRADIVTETDQHQHFQQIAPLAEKGLYLVPKVIE